MHVVRVMIWDGVVTETHHFLGGVDDHGLVNTGPAFLRGFLESPQSSDVTRPFKADRFQALFQAALDAGEPASSCSNYSNPFFGHGHQSASLVGSASLVLKKERHERVNTHQATEKIWAQTHKQM